MSPPEQTDYVNEDARLASLCVAFLASRYYKKAIGDIRYVREQAIGDFLKEHLPAPQPEAERLEEIVVMIRKNYYRYF